MALYVGMTIVGTIGTFIVLYLLALAIMDYLGASLDNTLFAWTAQVKSEVISFANMYKTLTTCALFAFLILCGAVAPSVFAKCMELFNYLLKFAPSAPKGNPSVKPEQVPLVAASSTKSGFSSTSSSCL